MVASDMAVAAAAVPQPRLADITLVALLASPRCLQGARFPCGCDGAIRLMDNCPLRRTVDKVSYRNRNSAWLFAQLGAFSSQLNWGRTCKGPFRYIHNILHLLTAQLRPSTFNLFVTRLVALACISAPSVCR